jgi:hypothetical protein
MNSPKRHGSVCSSHHSKYVFKAGVDFSHCEKGQCRDCSKQQQRHCEKEAAEILNKFPPRNKEEEKCQIDP